MSPDSDVLNEWRWREQFDACDDFRLRLFGHGNRQGFHGSEGVRVSGTTRSKDKAAALRGQGIDAFVFDGEVLDEELSEAMQEATHLVQSIAPREKSAIR